MNISLGFVRIFFIILSMLFMTAYMLSQPGGASLGNICMGIGIGAGLSLFFVGFDTFFRRFNLRAFNLALLGLFIGYLMGQALVLILEIILSLSPAEEPLISQGTQIIKIGLFLFGCYLGTVLTVRSADELSVSIPFVKFTPVAQKRKDLIVDLTALSDARILDLCTTGIFDHQLILPRFLVKELYALLETGEEHAKAKARKALDVIKKLETHPQLEIRYNESDFAEIKDLNGKIIRLARLLDGNILTADLSRVQTATIEGVRLINLHALSNALKPLMQAAEPLKIKIQRIGKEPRQGIGYLDDGTMVVVNGGGDFIGEIIDAQVLSVKHTSSGRMIFCNAQDEESRLYESEYEHR